MARNDLQDRQDTDRYSDESFNPAQQNNGQHDDVGGLSAKETSDLDQIEAGLRDTADQENNATEDDGQSSPVSNEEKQRLGSNGDDLADSPKWYRSDVRRAKTKRYVNKKKKKIMAAIVAVVATTAIGGFLYLPNIAIRTMTEKTTEFFYSRVEAITEKRLGKYFNGYVRKIILPSIDACGPSISISCDVIDTGDGRVGGVYKAWRDNKIEKSLLEKHGIVIKKDRGSSNASFFRVDANGKETRLGTSGKRSLPKEVLSAVNTETRSTNIIERWKVRSLLASKYGASKWCVIACKKRDDAGTKFKDAKTRLKVKIALRTVGAANEKAAIYILCFAINCSDEAFDRAGREAVQKYLGENADELLQGVSEDIGNKKAGRYFSQKLVEKILEQFVDKVPAQRAASAVPIAGQIYLAATLIEAAATIDDKIRDGEISKYLYQINEDALVQNYAVWQSIGDDVISGVASSEDTGAAFSIASGYNGSRVWQTINNKDRLSDVTCENGTVLSGSEAPLVCPEKTLNQTTFIEEWRQDPLIGSLVDSALSSYRCPAEMPSIGGLFDICLKPRAFVKPVLGGINYVIGAAGTAAINQVSNIPGVGGVLGFLGEKSVKFISYVTELAAENLLKSIVNPDAEDVENYDQYAASADLTSNAFLGGNPEDGGLSGRALSVDEDAEIQADLYEQTLAERKNQSFFARYLDINNVDSLVTTVAISLPGLIDSKPDNIIKAPYQNIASIGSLLSGNGFAATDSLSPAARQSMFGITQYGYSLDDPLLDIDPEELEDPVVCAAYAQAREATAVIDPITRQVVYTSANPCQTDDVIAEVIIKKYNLDQPRIAGASGTIDLSEFLKDKRQDTSNVSCARTGLVSSSLAAIGAGGVRINLCDYGGVRVNAAWSEAVVQMLEAASADGIIIEGSGYRTSQKQIELRKQNCPNWATSTPGECRPPTARPGASNHELGLAIDVTEIFRECGKDASVCPSNPVFRWLTDNAGQFGIKKLGSEAWHWSIDGG